MEQQYNKAQNHHSLVQSGLAMANPAPNPNVPESTLGVLINRSDLIISRLSSVDAALLELIGKLYGEGRPPAAEAAVRVNSVGSVSRMVENLGRMDAILDEITTSLDRLSSLT